MKTYQWLGAALFASCLAMSCVFTTYAQRPHLYSKQEPIRLDFDMQTIPKPATYETGYLWDFSNNTFLQPFTKLPSFGRKPVDAYNVNTLDEVPNSSWFTNRNGVRRMSTAEIKRGPNETDGPAPGPLTVVKGKTNGITPGFQIKDSRGDLYLLKFDPIGYLEMASAAEAISTRLFYAIGYNVPQNTIYRFRRDQLKLDPKATFTDNLGKKRQMTEADVSAILNLAAHYPNGEYRALASKFLSGKPVGNFKFAGVRDDDPNDIIPHEHRRDLRALRVFSAWLNHNDIRNGNNLDMFVKEDGREFIRHYLIDFGSTLGSDTAFPNSNDVGYAHQVDFAEARKSLLTFGLYQPHWRSTENRVRFTSVGNFASDKFKPHQWKSNFPLEAFQNMTDRDAYWAAKIVASFTDEQIRAAVATGELSDPKAAEYLTQQLIIRRDAIAREYFTRNAALDDLQLKQTSNGWIINFTDLRMQFAGKNEETTYEYQLAAADDAKRVLASGKLNDPQLTLSSDLLRQIATAGSTDANRGVAQLKLKRSGEKKEMTAWLFYDDVRNQLRLVGLLN
ncbi:MAG TPA: hypothetical protein VFZ34_16935 [Blastocatellia bacterium]|nr:hypothetical protein [Blastocatellia bacterium]